MLLSEWVNTGVFMHSQVPRNLRFNWQTAFSDQSEQAGLSWRRISKREELQLSISGRGWTVVLQPCGAHGSTFLFLHDSCFLNKPILIHLKKKKKKIRKIYNYEIRINILNILAEYKAIAHTFAHTLTLILYIIVDVRAIITHNWLQLKRNTKLKY